MASISTAMLPGNEWCPESTEGKEGFVHPVAIGGVAEHAWVQFIVRDFKTAKLAEHEARLQGLVDAVVAKHPGATAKVEVTEQYRNMRSVIDAHPHVVAYAREAIVRAGLTVHERPIRGGTDGSRLSFMGVPTPNIFAGEQNFHSRLEWVSVQDMEKAVDVILHLVQIWHERT